MCSEFLKIRGSLPPVVILTSREVEERMTSSPWTASNHPSAPVLHRMRQLAQEAVGVVSARMLAASVVAEDDVKVRLHDSISD